MTGSENDRKTVDDYRERNVAMKKRNTEKKESKVGRADSKEMTFCYGDSKELDRNGAAEKSSRFTSCQYEISRPFVVSDSSRLLGKVETAKFDQHSEEKEAIVDQNQDEMSFLFSLTRDNSVMGSAKTVDDFIDISKEHSEEKLIETTGELSEENLDTKIEKKISFTSPTKPTSQKELEFREIIDICKLNEVNLKKELGRNKSDDDINKRNSIVFDEIGKFELVPLNVYNSQRISDAKSTRINSAKKNGIDSLRRSSSRDSEKKKIIAPKSESKIGKRFFSEEQEKQSKKLSPSSNHSSKSVDDLLNGIFHTKDVQGKGENEMKKSELTGMH